MLVTCPAKYATKNSNAPSTVSSLQQRKSRRGSCETNVGPHIDLSASVDVYADWVDACDAVAKEGDDGGDLAPERAPARRSSGAAGKGDADDDDNDDDIMGDEDGMGGYGGDGIVADDEDY